MFWARQAGSLRGKHRQVGKANCGRSGGGSCGFRGKERARRDKQVEDWFAVSASRALMKFVVTVPIKTRGWGLSKVSRWLGVGQGLPGGPASGHYCTRYNIELQK